MRFPVAASVLLIQCTSTPSLTPQQTAYLVAACNIDGKVVPLAQTAVAAMGVPGQTAAAIDALLVHPAVLAACDRLRGKPTVTVTTNTEDQPP
jgi:predicted small secreted protein